MPFNGHDPSRHLPCTRPSLTLPPRISGECPSCTRYGVRWDTRGSLRLVLTQHGQDYGPSRSTQSSRPPPYCGSQKYVRSMKLELILTGCRQDELRRLDRQTLGTEAVTTRVTKVSDLLTGDHYVDRIIRHGIRNKPSPCKDGFGILQISFQPSPKSVDASSDHVDNYSSRWGGVRLLAYLSLQIGSFVALARQ